MRRAILWASVFALCGCIGPVGPDYEPPVAEVPEVFSQAWSDSNPLDGDLLARWWTTFLDSELDALVAEAETENLDLRSALSRIDQSRANFGVASGQFIPDIDAAGSFRLDRSSEESSLFPVETIDSYRVGLEASWEIDIFGRIRRQVEAASAEVDASIEDYRAVLVSLRSAIAEAYVRLRTLQARLAIAEQNATTQKETLRLVKIRVQAEDVSQLDQAQAESNLASTEATIPEFRFQIVAQLNRLAVLLGRRPGELRTRLEPARALPPMPERLLIGFPADLVRRRPDVRRAERLLAAQTARIGVATAALYPQFSLTGSIGLESLELSRLVRGSAHTFAFAPAVRWNIFDGFRVQEQIHFEEARAEQALIDWRASVLLALEDVESSLAAIKNQQERLAALRRAADAYGRAVRFARIQYNAGEIDFQSLFDAERQLLNFQDQAVASQGQLLLDTISLYDALGGGWSAAATDEESQP